MSKIALVTGASRGIGKSIAETLSAGGFTVLGTATSESGAEKIKTYATMGYVLKIADRSQVEQVIARINKEYGVPTVVVNNAGITDDGLFIRMKNESWDEVINTNLTGTYNLCRLTCSGMMKERWGRYIHIGSIVGTKGNYGQVNYAASKAGLSGLSKSLALEFATRNITSNVVEPGFIKTDMTQSLSDQANEEIMKKIPLKRMGEVSDVANAVKFLASDGASYITGQTIHVNGGMWMG